MEGAVRSGYLAAQEVLKSLDQPTRLIRPGLKQSLLARWLFGAYGTQAVCAETGSDRGEKRLSCPSRRRAMTRATAAKPHIATVVGSGIAAGEGLNS